MDERQYWLGFSAFSGIGPTRFAALLQKFGNARAAWKAQVLDLSQVIGEVTTSKFDKFRSTFSIEDYAKKLGDANVSFLTFVDREYPTLLGKIKNPPFVLYVKGALDSLGVLSGASPAPATPRVIAVVGTRSITNYGREVTELFVSELVASGFVIVSGLALGVDAIAHATTLAGGGKTIAVLGCGVDCCYPRENQALYDGIIKSGGLIVSEVPLGHQPTKGLFPARNRIIAGLSAAVLVTEGAEDSGSLITAEYAKKFGRPVFAVPGPITSSLSKGPYKLIEKGARLVTKGEDIMKELGIMNYALGTKKKQKRVRGDTEEETRILELLVNEPLHFDEIVKRTKLESSVVGTTLSLMEIKGMVKSQESGIFSVV